MSGISKLIRLCNIDLKYRRIENEFDTADDGDSIKSQLVALKMNLNKFVGAVSVLEKKHDQIKEKVRSGVSEKKKMESSLFSSDVDSKQIKNIQSHLKKITEHIDGLETTELELMEKLEKYRTYRDKLSEKYDKMKEIYGGIIAKYKSLVDKSKTKLSELKRSRDVLTSTMDEEKLTIYNKLADRKSGVAMAEVEGTLCTGCNQSISTSLDQRLAEEPEEIHYCNNCGRIIYRIKIEQ